MNKVKRTVISILNKTLPERLKRALFHLSFHLAPSEFDRFAYEVNHAPDMELGLAAVAKRGMTPKTIIDVGAFEGDWSKMARAIWPASRIYMIEPNRSKQDNLAGVARTIDATVFGDLLGAHDGTDVVFNVMSTGSSVYNERSPLDRTSENRQLKRLDSLLPPLEAPAFLKIDTQGYELEVLRGATRLLDRLSAILLEVAIIEINEGAPLLDEVVQFMRGIGFVAYDIMEIHRRPLDRATNQIDILFVRPESPLLDNKQFHA
ncbi:FkbM family methyltransferase [Bradyrhizobium manausense]|uniref:FkbM family methyltransferase n=1 Tax=Bradyrhizobium manausense TaxID=989370 RepID=UPI001BACD5DF|nr:FkbM family methyltransferase [Bradyrhizobium manausense]MBR0685659.1 FkbM family methyltransferase [Bradyrhizobium manausense]